MELEDIIKEIILKRGVDFIHPITKEDLIPYYYHLINCKYFKGCNVQFLNDEGLKKSQLNKTVKLSKTPMFKGNLHIDNFIITPAVYNVDELIERPNNDGLITPTFISPIDFKPYKIIKIWFDPTELSDDKIKKELVDKIDDILSNQEKYSVFKTHCVLMKGIYSDNDTYDKNNSFEIKF